jgi:REP element-mobilizing transposase RayT
MLKQAAVRVSELALACFVVSGAEFIQRSSQQRSSAVSFWRTFYHLVWTTKEREPLITARIEARLYPYLIHKAAELEVYITEINGWTDHVHLIAIIPPKIAVSDVVKHLKGASAHDLNHERAADGTFAWQRGYGVLTIGSRQRSDAESYVRAQKQHHRDQTALAWLEHEADADEGPPDAIAVAHISVPALHETHANYDPWGECPF